MFIAFFESFKYAGHLWPVALLRMYIGAFFLHSGLEKVDLNYLKNPVLISNIQSLMDKGAIQNPVYARFLQDWVIVHWQTASYILVTSEVAVGICLILGFMVRPAALVGLALCINFLISFGPESASLYKLFIAVLLALFFLAAGRCLGFDYYFYKKIRGFWW